MRPVGPADGAQHGLDVPQLIRAGYRAAGGDHEDRAAFDGVTAAERRCAVFVRAERVCSNPAP